MFKYVVMVCALVCLLAAAPALAAKSLVGNFTYDDLGGSLQVVVKNEKNFRINIDDDEDVFLLMTNGKRWMVGRDNDESNWEAIDFEVLMEYLFEMDALGASGYGKGVITKAGAQKVGGIDGEGFTVTYDDDTFNLIVTKNADVATLTKAIFSFLEGIDDEDIQLLVATLKQVSDENKKVYGLLQYDDDFVFNGLERKNFPDSYFTLPAEHKVLDLNDLFGSE